MDRKKSGVSLLVCVFAVVGLISISVCCHAAFFEKTFIVKQDQGQDVLCDPYIVQKNDYVSKIFTQRGDISYTNFPKFLDIFKRLNPDIKDVDLIYPNQRILIPLKIIEPNSMPGQASGIVKIPVITITNLPDTLKKYSEVYEVKYGDWVSKLIAERFGPYGSKSYEQGMKLFESMNPDLKDPNRIYAGEKIKLPNPAIRNASWYPALFNRSGELVQAGSAPKEKPAEEKKPAPEKPIPKTAPPPVKPIKLPPAAPETVKPIQTPAPAKTTASPPKTTASPGKTTAAAPEAHHPEKPAKSETAAVKPPPKREMGFADQSVFAKAATALGAQFLNSGEYFFPRSGKSDYRLDLSDTPVMVFSEGIRLLFTKEGWISDADQKVISSYWKDVRFVYVRTNTSLEEMLKKIIPIIHPHGYEKRFSFTDRDVSFVLRGSYIYNVPGDNDKVCLDIIKSEKMRTPDPICRYLEDHDIIVRDWIESPTYAGWAAAAEGRQGPLPEVIRIEPPDASHLIPALAKALGYRYQKNVEISFPYAGIQLKAVINLLSLGQGREVLIDYGSIGGDAVQSIEKTGFQIIQIRQDEGIDQILQTLSALLPITCTDGPIFWTAARPRIINPSFQVRGYLIRETSERPEKQVLLTRASLPDELAVFLHSAGVVLMRISK